MKNIIITFLYKEGAGPVFTLEMAKGLAANGYNVYAVLSNKISNRNVWEKESSIKNVHFIETGNRETAIQATAYFFFVEQSKLKRQYKNIHFDYVISTFYHPWAKTLLKCFSGRKIVICHDPIHHSGVKLMERVMTTRYIKSADDVIVLTKSFIPIVEQRFGFSPKNIHYMPHGRMEEYKKQAESLTEDIKYEVDKNIHFLFFGRIEKYKGLHILAKAYKLLASNHCEVTLSIVGSGNFQEYVNEFGHLPQVQIVNSYIPDNKIQSYFSKPNTVLVLPYLDASQSGVIPIALEYGIPIIASDTGGLKEQLNNGQIGLFCKANDVDSLFKQMETILNKRDIFKSEHKKSQIFLKSIEWKNVTKIFLNL